MGKNHAHHESEIPDVFPQEDSDELAEDNSPGARERRSEARHTANKLKKATAFVLVFCVVEIIGGYISGSLAIITDAAHLLTDVSGFVLAILANQVASSPPSKRFTFGFARAEVLSAFASTFFVFVLAAFLLYSAVVRIVLYSKGEGEVIDGMLMTIIATLGLLVNIVLLTIFREEHDVTHHGFGGHDHSHGHGHGHAEDGHDDHDYHDDDDSHHGHHDEDDQETGGHFHGNGKGHSGGGHHDDHDDHGHEHGHDHGSSGGLNGSGALAGLGLLTGKKKAGGSGSINGGEKGKLLAPASPPSFSVAHGGYSALESGTGGGSCGLHDHDDDEHGHDDHDDHDHHGHDHSHNHHAQEVEKGDDHHGHSHEHNQHGCGSHDDHDDHHGSHSHHGHGHEEGQSKKETKSKQKRRNVNMEAAVLHAVTDMIQSIGVMIAGIIIWIRPDWQLADPVVTIVFALLVCNSTKNILNDTLHVLLQGAPKDIDYNELKQRLAAIDGVLNVHSLHVWSLTVGRTVCTMHILARGTDDERVLAEVHRLCESVGIGHTTVQIQRDHCGVDGACDHPCVSSVCNKGC